MAQRHALHVERTAEKAFLGPLGFDFAQHRHILRPSVVGTRSKALCPFGSQERIPRISSTVQTAHGKRLKSDPKVGHMRCPQVGTRSFF